MSAKSFRSLGGAALAVLLTTAACDGTVGPNSDAKLILFANLAGTSVSTVVVNVTASDISAPLVFNIAVINGIATDTIAIPAGSNRTIAMQAYDANGVETHSGSTVVDIQPGTNPTITIVMQPLTGDLPITVSLGSQTVAVSPSALQLPAADTARLTAAITDWNGHPVSGSVRWATSDPSVATVDASGLVTAVRSGSTTVVATFQGAGGHATVTVP
ncbi:MAG TPA: Ig-like domain-containing protein [Gemmatimonadales bacterium]|nr:Ig-like domain-containing protein [Gemmatimonadales bacterium]